MNYQYLFVYGTLQKEADNEMSRFLMQHSTIMGRGFMLGKLYRISWFPGVVASKDKKYKVYGTIFKLDSASEVFKTLDAYEGFDTRHAVRSLFVRQKVEVFLKNGDAVTAWVYLYNQNIEDKPRIISGDFLKDANT